VRLPRPRPPAVPSPPGAIAVGRPAAAPVAIGDPATGVTPPPPPMSNTLTSRVPPGLLPPLMANRRAFAASITMPAVPTPPDANGEQPKESRAHVPAYV